jgi:hypothetical protein
MPVFIRQYAWGVSHRKDFDGSGLDAMNQRQVDAQQGRSHDALLDLLTSLAPKAVAGRSRRARLLGRAPITVDEAGSWYEGMPTRTTMGELCAVVLTRDAWMHRLDIARAVGKSLAVDPSVDGRMVADVVVEWSRRHGQPVDLTLTGEAGGEFRMGHGGQSLTLDALDFARVMAGRRPEGQVPDSPLLATKVLF